MASVASHLFAITGAASGIGRATAELLAKGGALLSLADKDEGAVQQFANDLTCGGKIRVFSKQVDVCDREQVETWIAETVKHFGRPLDGKSSPLDRAGAYTGHVSMLRTCWITKRTMTSLQERSTSLA